MTEPSPDQVDAINRILIWYVAAPEAVYCDDVGCCPYEHRHEPECARAHTHGEAQDHPVLALGGLAGSGKTWLIGQLDQALGIVPAYGTPTNKAAAVLRAKLNPVQRERVKTYHSLLYQARSLVRCGQSRRLVTELEPGEDGLRRFSPCQVPAAAHTCHLTEELRFERRQTVGGHRDLIVLDEASMVTEERVQEIRQFGLPVLLVGDHGQLPPVQATGGMSRWMRDPDVLLTANHRQGEASGIVAAALRVRDTGVLPLGRYGDGSTVCVSAAQAPEVLDVMSPTRFPPGPDRVVITHTNKMRAAVNRQFHGDEPTPVVGDRVVALANLTCPTTRLIDDTWERPRGLEEGHGLTLEEPVYNGCTGTVRHVFPTWRGGGQTVRLVVELDADHRGEAGTHVETTAALGQFAAETPLALNQRPHGAHLWDYAYALTAHKAQGSEFRDVVVLDTHPPEYRRWLYTAMTRARERLVVVNWKR